MVYYGMKLVFPTLNGVAELILIQLSLVKLRPIPVLPKTVIQSNSFNPKGSGSDVLVILQGVQTSRNYGSTAQSTLNDDND
jgi:hypothetical protein